jgi:hypothetical protein
MHMPEEKSAQEVAAEIVSGLVLRSPSAERARARVSNGAHTSRQTSPGRKTLVEQGREEGVTATTVLRRRRREQLRDTAERHGVSMPSNSATLQLTRFARAKKTDPLAAFLTQIYEANGNVEYYRSRIRELHSLYVAGRSERQEVQAVVRLYNDERDRLHKYLATAAKLGLEARVVRLQEMQAQQIVAVISDVVDGLGLAPEQRARAHKLAADALREQAKATRPVTVYDQVNVTDGIDNDEINEEEAG